MSQNEYHEGPEVLERFKSLMTRAFQAPKSKTPFAKPKVKKAGSKAAPKKRVPKRVLESGAG